MSWFNCKVQRKSDNKELEAHYENGRCEDITGAYLDPENYRVVELEEDYIDDGKLVPVVDFNMSDPLWLVVCGLIILTVLVWGISKWLKASLAL